MRNTVKYVAIVIVVSAAVFVFLQKGSGVFGLQTATLSTAEDNVERIMPIRYFLSPFKMIPFVSQKQSRKNICSLKIDGPIETICGRKYSNVRAGDTAKIDELFLILREVNDDGAPTETAKYLTTQLIFSTLPRGAARKAAADMARIMQTSTFSSRLVAQNDSDQPVNAGISRADYINQMQSDFDRVKSNCPQPGNENWVFNAMCSEYTWVNDEEEPIYSRQYAEYGGPCRSEAGQIENTQIESVVHTKMRTEYDFVSEEGVSSQIACSFSCGSYKCPQFEQEEIERTQCKNPIYYPFYNRKEGDKITLKDKSIAFSAVNSECRDRSYDYVKNPDGTSALKKVRTCKMNWHSDTSHIDSVLGRSIPVRTYCCSCDRPEQDPYVSIYDFTQSRYEGEDWFKEIIDGVRKKTEDAPPAVSDLPSDGDAFPKVLRFRFKCAITSEWWNGATKIKDFSLKASADPIDENGALTYATPVGVSGAVANTGSSCQDDASKAPICVDPRTNEKTDGPLEFVKEYRNWEGNDERIKKEFNDMFQLMIGGKRSCRQDEMPRES